MDDKNRLKEKLVEKMTEEYRHFLKELECKTPKEIIDAAYEKVFKEDIILAVDENDFSIEQIKALNNMKFPLDSCYVAWLKSDDSYMEILFLCVKNYANSVSNFKKNEVENERRKEKMAKNNDTITFEIKERIAVLAKNATGWSKELNLVSWNGGNPKYDIRDWNEDHSHMSRGITLTVEEMKKLRDAVVDRNLETAKENKEKDYER